MQSCRRNHYKAANCIRIKTNPHNQTRNEEKSCKIAEEIKTNLKFQKNAKRVPKVRRKVANGYTSKKLNEKWQKHCKVSDEMNTKSIGITKLRRGKNLHELHRLFHSYKSFGIYNLRRGKNLHELHRLFHSHKSIGIKKSRRGRQIA